MAVELVKSSCNKADQLTRVPKKWLSFRSAEPDSHGDVVGLAAPASRIAADDETRLELKRIHDRHHFGVDRTWELARQSLGQRVSRTLVKSVVSKCRQCVMIDPAVTFRWQKGTLAADAVWQRLALDIIHVNGWPYL